MAKQGCNAHVGKAVSLQPRLQLLLGDIRRDERVGAITRITRAVHVVVEHPYRLKGGDHNAKSSWQCVHLRGVSTTYFRQESFQGFSRQFWECFLFLLEQVSNLTFTWLFGLAIHPSLNMNFGQDLVQMTKRMGMKNYLKVAR